jgi:carbamoyltransferase
MMTSILGISAFYHDSAAALIRDGIIIAAAQEERFSRKKHDAVFPSHAIHYCLTEVDARLTDIDYIVFYDKPILKFDRLLETYLATAPRGFKSFITAMPVWLKEKLYLKALLKQELANIAGCTVKDLPALLFAEHHQSHAASAFFPSPFERAAILCMDGVGEWATTSVWLGEGNTLRPKWQLDFPHSLGMLYSAFTYFTGFKVNSGEYKLMGLAPYGEPRYTNIILDNLLDLKSDGTFHMDMRYFDYMTGLCMTSKKIDRLFDGPPRKPESPITQREMDIAASIQAVTEEIVIRLSHTIKQELGIEYLCLAGGVALNCVANGKLLSEELFKDIWIQPAAGDAGGAIGAALTVWYEYLQHHREPDKHDSMSGSFLGPSYSNEQIKFRLDASGTAYTELPDAELLSKVAEILADGKVVGWFQGRMEFGPRALGGRSILGDPRNKTMQKVMNLKIKYRESFRPFAPSVLGKHIGEYFEMKHVSPYMLFVADVKQNRRTPANEQDSELFGIEKLNLSRSDIPAVTHVDYSARIQTVHKETNPRYYKLLEQFKEITGCAVLVNTSFNVRGEPIVCTPEDAYRCFMNTEMDYLVMENCLLSKVEQEDVEENIDWQTEYELD